LKTKEPESKPVTVDNKKRFSSDEPKVSACHYLVFQKALEESNKAHVKEEVYLQRPFQKQICCCIGQNMQKRRKGFRIMELITH
jgi:hypothetical protein